MGEPYRSGSEDYRCARRHHKADAQTREQMFSEGELPRRKNSAHYSKSWQNEHNQNPECDSQKLRHRDDRRRDCQRGKEAGAGQCCKASRHHGDTDSFRPVLELGTQDRFSIRETSKIWIGPES
jgi:hypothetical protein